MINESGGKLANWLPLLLLLPALLAKWQAEFLMVSPMQTKPKAIDKKTTSTFEVAEPGAAAAPTQSINHALWLRDTHSHRISLCVGVQMELCAVCCRCCGSPLWLIVCQKDCPFKIAIRRACWQVILAKTLLVQPCLASASACVWPEWLGSRAERLTRLPALSQLSHSCQRAINAIYSFIFANLRRRHRWQRQRDTSRCPSNLNIKQPKKSCSCVCNAILFDLFEKKIE